MMSSLARYNPRSLDARVMLKDLDLFPMNLRLVLVLLETLDISVKVAKAIKAMGAEVSQAVVVSMPVVVFAVMDAVMVEV